MNGHAPMAGVGQVRNPDRGRRIMSPAASAIETNSNITAEELKILIIIVECNILNGRLADPFV
jgi:hypothetical protein